MFENHQRRHESTTKTVKGIFKKDDLDDSLSTSDWGLEDNNSRYRKQNVCVKLVNEPLRLICEWNRCNAEYDDYISYTSHSLRHLNCDELDESFECLWNGCNYTAPTPTALRQHLSYHVYHSKLLNIGRNVELREKLPACNQTDQFQFPEIDHYECNWEFCTVKSVTIHDFLAHMEYHIFHTPTGPLEGPIYCGWKGCTNKVNLKRRTRLREHLRTHSMEKVIACPSCGQVFANRTKFCDHRKRQIPLKQQSYLCSQCSKYFPTERLLRDHMRLHINHYKCSMCEMTCPKPTTLAKHIRYRHMQEKPYKCDCCDYSCVSKHNLDVHLKTHLEKNSFKCPLCPFEARSALTLKKHSEKKHGKRKCVYECHTCNKRFDRGNFLTRHLMKAHNYHWPAGHSRFRFKLEQKGVYRLQTVRYETLDVTEAIIKDNKKQQSRIDEANPDFALVKRAPANAGTVEKYDVVVKEREEAESKAKQVLITINDLDSKGNVLKSETIQSKEIGCDEVDTKDFLVFRNVES